jgi:tetratricopeptide (TPR) repeat protein
MRRLQIRFICMAMLLPAAMASPSQAQQSRDWTRCVNKDPKSSPDLVIGGCTAVIQSAKEGEKNLIIAFSNRGNAYIRKNRYGPAIDDYTQTIRLDPGAAVAFYSRGTAYLDTGQFGRAVEDFDQAIRLDPQYASAFNNRGNAYALQQQYDRAIDDYSEAIRLDPRHANAFNGRGSAYSRKDQYDRAIEDFNKAISLDPKDALPVTNRGNAHAFKAQYPRAIEDYNRAIRLDANQSDAFNGRCWARAALGRDLQAALADCNHSILLDADYANGYGSRAFVYLKLGEFDLAISDYEVSLRLEPKSPHSLYGRGYARQKKGDAAGAAADIAAAKAIQPDIAEVYAKLGLK